MKVYCEFKIWVPPNSGEWIVLRRFAIGDVLSMKRLLQSTRLHLSRDGNWLAYSISHSQRRQRSGEAFTETGAPVFAEGSEIEVIAVDSASSETLTPGWGASWSPRWAPNCEQLVFYSDRTETPQLWLWERKDRSHRLLCDAAIHAAFRFEIPRWTKDGRYVLTKLALESQSDPKELEPMNPPMKDPIARVWQHIPPEAEEQRPARHKDLGLIEVATGEVCRLIKGIHFSDFAVAPDGKKVAVLDMLGGMIWVASLDGSGNHCVAEGVICHGYGMSLSWSPDSRYIAYLSGANSHADLHVADTNTGEITNVTEANEPKILGADHIPPLWHPDGKRCFCMGKRNVWEIPIMAGDIRNLTEDFALPVYNMLHRSSEQTVWLQDEKYLCLQTWNSETNQSGWYSLDYQTGATEKLLEEDSFHWGWHESPFHTDVSPKTGRAVYIAEYSNMPPEVFSSDLSFHSPRQISRLNPNIPNFSFGETRVISWKSPSEKDLRACLLMPVDYQEGKRYPLIVYIYPGFPLSSYVNVFGVSEVETDNLQIFANHGYAVLAPNTPITSGPPMPQLPDSVFSAIDHVVDLGIADTRGLGIMGHSFGGYGVNFLVTQDTRFSAAVSAAGLVDLVSGYSAVSDEGYASYGMFEEWMEGTLWEQRARYIENSPVFDLDKVETPMLIIVGSEQRTDVLQAEEAFSGLRRLDKKVVLANYLGQGHSLSGWSHECRHDYWERILVWFDEHLKGHG